MGVQALRRVAVNMNMYFITKVNYYTVLHATATQQTGNERPGSSLLAAGSVTLITGNLLILTFYTFKQQTVNYLLKTYN